MGPDSLRDRTSSDGVAQVKTALIEIGGLAIYGLFTAHVTLMAMMAEPQAAEIAANAGPQARVIFEDTRLLMCCVIGAFLGACLNVFVSPIDLGNEPREAMRKVAARMLASLISGVIFAPMIVRYFQIELNLDTLLFVAGVTSFLAVGVLDGVAPMLIAKAKAWLASKVEQ